MKVSWNSLLAVVLIFLLGALAHSYAGHAQLILLWGGGMVMFLLDVAALFWTGLYSAVTTRTPNQAASLAGRVTAGNPNGPFGTLPPGFQGSITLSYVPITVGANILSNFTLQALQDPNQPFDWNALATANFSTVICEPTS